MQETIQDWRQLKLNGTELILCAGKSRMSKRIRQFQKLTGATEPACDITHLAKGFNPFICTLPLPACFAREWSRNGLFVLESTSLNKWADKRGVQINSFEQWLNNYNGKVYVCPTDIEPDDEYKKVERKFWHEHKSMDYEHGIPGALQLLLCGLRLERYVKKVWPSYKPISTVSPHCTELIAMNMQTHDHIEKGLYKDRLPPWAWWQWIDTYLKYNKSKPIRIK